MTELNVSIQGTIDGKATIVFNQNLTKETIEQIHWLLSTFRPNDAINLTTNNGHTIQGQPLNPKM